MKSIPENLGDVKEILLNQMKQIEQETLRHPTNVAQLSMALCELVHAYIDVTEQDD